jgi:hypothetical protein
MKEQLIKRLKSFLWRAGMVALAAFLAYAAENIGLLELSPQATVIIGLVLGEISKFLNTPTV